MARTRKYGNPVTMPESSKAQGDEQLKTYTVLTDGAMIEDTVYNQGDKVELTNEEVERYRNGGYALSLDEQPGDENEHIDENAEHATADEPL